MSKINHDLTKVLKPKYHKKWVALNHQQTKVVAYGISPKKVVKEAQKKGVRKPVIFIALKDYSGLAP